MNPGRQGDPMNCQYVAIATDGGNCLAHFGRAHTTAVFCIQDGQVVSREDRIKPDTEHLDPAHHRLMLDLARGCDVVIAAHVRPPMIASLSRLGVEVLRAPSQSMDAAPGAYVDH
jgi:predicted Fe-Mo cluster-binding NifX family protein